MFTKWHVTNVSSSTIYKSPDWKLPKCLSTVLWIMKLWYSHIMEYYTTLTMRVTCTTTQPSTWINVTNTMMSHRSGRKKRTYIVRVHFYNTGKWTCTRAVRSQISGYPRGGGRQWVSGRDDKCWHCLVLDVGVGYTDPFSSWIFIKLNTWFLHFSACMWYFNKKFSGKSIDHYSPMPANANILDMF